MPTGTGRPQAAGRAPARVEARTRIAELLEATVRYVADPERHGPGHPPSAAAATATGKTATGMQDAKPPEETRVDDLRPADDTRLADDLRLVVRCTDLTTLEGDDTPGRIRALCSQALRPDPADPTVGPVAAVCVYPALAPAGRRAARRHPGGGGQRGRSLPQRPVAPGGEGGRSAGRGGRRRHRDRHCAEPLRLPLRSPRCGRGGAAGTEGGGGPSPLQGDPRGLRTRLDRRDRRSDPAGHGRRRRHGQDLHRQGRRGCLAGSRAGDGLHGGRALRRRRSSGGHQGGRRGPHRRPMPSDTSTSCARCLDPSGSLPSACASAPPACWATWSPPLPRPSRVKSGIIRRRGGSHDRSGSGRRDRGRHQALRRGGGGRQRRSGHRATGSSSPCSARRDAARPPRCA